MHFFIPGGAGYIGSVLTDELLRLNHRVTVLDNFFYKQNSLLHLMRHPHLKIISGDFRDEKTVAELARHADVVIPLAALVGAPLCNLKPQLAHEVNSLAPIKLFEKLSADQIILMPTTNSAYGSGDAQNFCDENSPLKPISTYAKMKVEVETALLQKNNSVSFRLATVFGVSPRMRLDLLVNDFTYRAVRDRHLSVFEGHFKRNYIHILDVVGAFIHTLENFQSMKNNIFNVGLSSANISKLELCRLIQTHIPQLVFTEDMSGKDPDQRNYIVSNAKLEKTGFLPRYNLSHGIEEIIKAYPLLSADQMRNI